MKTKNTIILAVASAMSLMLVASCNKAERIVVPEEETAIVAEDSGITVAEAVDNLTKSVAKEDPKDLSLFLKLFLFKLTFIIYF